MLAWHLRESPGLYEWGEVPTPEPDPGEARVAVRASALNHLDLWPNLGLPRPPSFPHVAGNDVAGVVDAVGEGVDSWRVGDEVVVNTAVVPEAALERGVDSVLDPGMEILDEVLALTEYPIALERLREQTQLGELVVDHTL